ncbi:MAG: hypothetical protein R2864_08885 [Syntrophotaleaceae bacterium]
MLIGFVSAGLLTLHQAVVILGANIGTTVTSGLLPSSWRVWPCRR